MRKFLLTFFWCCLLNGVLSAQQYPDSWHETGGVGDVMNVYQYDRICPSKFRGIVPFFRPSSVSNATCLIINMYAAEKYYGDDVKAGEYPQETYKAFYNVYGCLYRIDEETGEYRFSYDNNGILESICCYDKNTGRLITENKKQPPFNFKVSSDKWTVVKNASGEYWYIYGYNGEFSTSSTVFLNIVYKDGFRAEYNLAFRTNKPGEEMLVLRYGRDYASPEWLKKHIYGNWKKEDTKNLAYQVFRYKDFGKRTAQYCDYYNEVGLTGSGKMTLRECLSHGVRDNKWYEYQWIQN